MGELEKVRSILFGEQIRIYEERMKKIEDGLNEKIAQISGVLEDFKQSQEEKLDALDKSLVSTLETQTRNLEQDFKEKIEALAKEFRDSLGKLEGNALNRAKFAKLLTDLAGEIAPQERDEE